MALKLEQQVFLIAFGNCGVVREAANTAGICRSTVWNWRRGAEFSRAYEQAKEFALLEVEDKAHQLAVSGNPRMIMFLLERLRPEVYAEKVSIDLAKLTDEEIERLLRLQKIVVGG